MMNRIALLLPALLACSGDSPTESARETPPGNARFVGEWHPFGVHRCDGSRYRFTMQGTVLSGTIDYDPCDESTPPIPLPLVEAAYPILTTYDGLNLTEWRFYEYGPGDADDELDAVNAGPVLTRWRP